jgi:hypothetical protein
LHVHVFLCVGEIFLGDHHIGNNHGFLDGADVLAGDLVIGVLQGEVGLLRRLLRDQGGEYAFLQRVDFGLIGVVSPRA